IINASDTVYIAHDIQDLIKEFKETRAKEENIKVKLKGFKAAYDLENTDEAANKVSLEHHYDAMQRRTMKKAKMAADE
ncbi:MAG TPA: SulP family inorganic anion transporter, partial [Flavobacterium sp.]|nr:SulP family inorganic anion transporter [Flavobacterium sp.]